MVSKATEATSYNEVAEEFDRQVGRWALPFAERLCALAGVSPGDQVLDVGAGTGLAARAAARRVGGGGKVLATDLAEGMLAVGEARGRKEGLVPHILRFQVMDAERLDLADDSVDVALSLYAFLHFTDPAAALAELKRVLRPGGRLCIGVGSGPPFPSIRGGVFLARRIKDRAARELGLRAEMPPQLLGLLDEHLPAGSERGTEGSSGLGSRPGRAIGRLIEGLGFNDVKHSWRGAIDQIDDPEEFWALQASLCSEARYRILDAPPDAVDRLHRACVAASWKVLDRGGRLLYPGGAWYITARAGARCAGWSSKLLGRLADLCILGRGRRKS